MAKVLERSQVRYDTDLLAWAEQQAARLRAGQLDRLDVEHLIEELEAMAGKLRRELKNRLRVLLAHLLKWQAQPKRRSRSWAATIAEQRDQIEALLEESPSLRQDLNQIAMTVYLRAVRLAAIETGLARQAFPPELPYTTAQLLDEDLAD
jgi:aconitase A